MVLPLPHTLHHQASLGLWSMMPVHLHSTCLRLHHNTTCGLHCSDNQSLRPLPVNNSTALLQKVKTLPRSERDLVQHIDKALLHAEEQQADQKQEWEAAGV